MYYKKEEVVDVNFLASADFKNFTYQINDTGVTVDENGRKIVKGGSVYKNSNGVAIGLVFRDIDVTNGPQPGAVMIEGYVISTRLPAVVTEADKATMKNIVFKDEYDAQSN